MTSLSRGAVGFVGGALIGGWLYGLLWGLSGPDEATPWGLWGLAGLALGAIVYAARLLPPQARATGLIVIGIATGLLLSGAANEGREGFWGLAITTVGSLLAVATLPLPATLRKPATASDAPA